MSVYRVAPKELVDTTGNIFRNMILDLFCIMFIVVIITDLSGFPQSLYRGISSFLTKGRIVSSGGNLKILTCSFCQTHWLSLIYLIVNNELTIRTYTIILGISLLSSVTKDLLINIKDKLIKVVNL